MELLFDAQHLVRSGVAELTLNLWKLFRHSMGFLLLAFTFYLDWSGRFSLHLYLLDCF